MPKYDWFASPDGREVLDDLKDEFSNVHLGDPNPYVMAQKVGAHTVIQYIESHIEAEEKKANE